MSFPALRAAALAIAAIFVFGPAFARAEVTPSGTSAATGTSTASSSPLADAGTPTPTPAPTATSTATTTATSTSTPAPTSTASPTPPPTPTPTPEINCGITEDDLQAIDAAAAKSFSAELTARRALLIRVIDCAETNVQALQTSLSNITPANTNAASLQSQLSGKLSDALNYYNLELSKVGTAGVAGTKQIANEVLSWRTGNYDPLAAEIADFVLWSQNQAIFTTAQNRLTQIGNIVSFVEQAAPNTQLQQDYTQAQALITNAQRSNLDALNALTQFAPADQVLSSITASLQSLSDAYKQFGNISTIIQSLLPLPTPSTTPTTNGSGQ